MFCFSLQEVEVGLQLRALKLLCEATRKADEEVQSYSQEFVETNSIIKTYMALANFCDKRLREEEQSGAGESLPNSDTMIPEILMGLINMFEQYKCVFPSVIGHCLCLCSQKANFPTFCPCM